MTNSTSTDITFGDAWCSRVLAKEEDSQQINEEMLHPIFPMSVTTYQSS